MNSVLAIIVLLSLLLIGYFYYVSQKSDGGSSGSGGGSDDHHGTDPGGGGHHDDKKCVTNSDCYPNICDNTSKICTIGSVNIMMKIILLQASIADYCDTVDMLGRLSPKLFDMFESGLVNINNFYSNKDFKKGLFLPLDITDQRKAFQANLDKLNALNYCKDLIAGTDLNIKSSYTEVENKLGQISSAITSADNTDAIRTDMGNLLGDMYSYPFKLVDHLVGMGAASWTALPILGNAPVVHDNLVAANGAMLTISQLLNESHDKFHIIIQNLNDTYTYITQTYMG